MLPRTLSEIRRGELCVSIGENGGHWIRVGPNSATSYLALPLPASVQPTVPVTRISSFRAGSAAYLQCADAVLQGVRPSCGQ